MKRKIISILTAVLTAISLTACSVPLPDSVSAGQEDIKKTTKDVSSYRAVLSTASVDDGNLIFVESADYIGNENYQFTTERIVFNDDINKYDIQYPQIEFDDNHPADRINEILKDCASYEMNLMYPNFKYNSSLDKGRRESVVEYEVSYCDDNIFSVLFYDHYFVGSTVSEYYDVRAITIDLQNECAYATNDVLIIDDELAGIVYDFIVKTADNLANLPKFTPDVVKEAMLAGKTRDSRYTAQLYVEGNKCVGIAFSYHYNDGNVITRGDVEIALDDSYITDKMVDSSLWTYLGKTE